jgi:hypothetical protein
VRGDLRNLDEALVLEMRVKAECGPDPQGAHDLETHTINQTEISPSCRQNGTDAGTVYCTVNEMKVHDGQNILLKKSRGFHPESALRQGEASHDYVITRGQPFIVIQETGPCSDCMFMAGVCTIKERIER